ncbi:MAG: CTP synthase [Tissierellia bacterium]|nr:CTP synthase [Tissierellia bacterium]
MTKFIFITGGVVSGIGKGISGASIGRLLKDKGFSVFMQKFDPYLNVDPGTMSPYQHGEVFVTKDGAETDLDLGHYERFIDEELTQKSSITTGRIYSSVIKKERRGDYDGATVQVIPHITDEIKKAVYDVAKESEADIIITEIGGTIGDIESLPFIEAIRQVHAENVKEDVLFIHTTLVPTIPGSDELKTKPTQHSFKELMSLGIKTNIIITRSDGYLTDDIKDKISLFCDVPKQAIVQSENVNLIYEVPLTFKKQGLDEYILHKLDLKAKKDHDNQWEDMVKRFKCADKPLNIGLVGKYTELHDAYLSVANALLDAGYENGHIVEIQWIDSSKISEVNYKEKLSGLDGIIVPGGFGRRGLEGMVLASRYARETNTPFFGICLGMQMAVVDIARNVIGHTDAHTTECNPDTTNPVIDMIESKKNVEDLGSTLRLGNYECRLKDGTKIKEMYGVDEIVERHRHRYEVNNAYIEQLEENGVVISGINEERGLVEAIELKDHPHFVACQFHPEFTSRPTKIHPLFNGFIKKSIENKDNR